MKNYIYTMIIGASMGVAFASNPSNCEIIGEQIKNDIRQDSTLLLEVFSKSLEVNPNCVCEIIKATISGADLSAEQIASLVEVSITAMPDQMSLISQCAIASAPDAINEIQAVVAKLDPNSGESVVSSKDGGKVADKGEDEAWNPLDFPGDEKSEVGPRLGTGGGSSSLMPGFQFDSPPVVDSPDDTTNPNAIEG